MRAIRKYLMRDRKLPATAYDVMGYWRASHRPAAARRRPRADLARRQGAGAVRRGDLGRSTTRRRTHDQPTTELPVRLRVVRRPAQRRQVHAHQRAGRPEGRDHLRQAADHADRGARHRAPPGRTAGARRHPRAAPAADPARRAAQRPGPDDLGRGRRGRGLLPERREDRPGRPVHRHRDVQGASVPPRSRSPPRPTSPRRSGSASTCSTSSGSAPRPAPSGPRSSRSRRSPATRSSCSRTCCSACCRRDRSSTRTATSPTPPRRSWSPS